MKSPEGLPVSEYEESGIGMEVTPVRVAVRGEEPWTEASEYVHGVYAYRSSETELLGEGQTQLVPVRDFPCQGSRGGGVAVVQGHVDAVIS